MKTGAAARAVAVVVVVVVVAGGRARAQSLWGLAPGKPPVLPAAAAAGLPRPDDGLGWAQRGRTLLMQGQTGEALLALRRAAQLGESGQQVLMPLAWLLAQEGDLSGALVLFRRLGQGGAGQALLLRRTGDVLMAMGRLSEAVSHYQRACSGPRSPPLGTGRDVARACYALAMALDRQELFQPAAAALRSALSLDPEQRTLAPAAAPDAAAAAAGDFLPLADRVYLQGVLAGHAGRPCEQAAALRGYLEKLGQGHDLGPPPGWGYTRRAHNLLDRLASECKPEYSGRTDVPLGSQRDRDGGVPWQT